MIAKGLFNTYIKGTEHGKFVGIERAYLCNVKKSLVAIMNNHKECRDRKAYLSTKSLKHMYDRHIFDKKNPADFYVIVDNMSSLLKYPDEIFINLPEKTGDFIFVKKINKQLYMASIEIVNSQEIEIVSASATGEKYLAKFNSLWSWGNG